MGGNFILASISATVILIRSFQALHIWLNKKCNTSFDVKRTQYKELGNSTETEKFYIKHAKLFQCLNRKTNVGQKLLRYIQSSSFYSFRKLETKSFLILFGRLLERTDDRNLLFALSLLQTFTTTHAHPTGAGLCAPQFQGNGRRQGG